MLLAAGADARLCNKYGKTPLSNAQDSANRPAALVLACSGLELAGLVELGPAALVLRKHLNCTCKEEAKECACEANAIHDDHNDLHAASLSSSGAVVPILTVDDLVHSGLVTLRAGPDMNVDGILVLMKISLLGEVGLLCLAGILSSRI